MSSYIFTTTTPVEKKTSKAKEATENMRKYRQDRQTIVKNYIKTIIEELDAKISEVSRKVGAGSLDFNYSKIPINLDNQVIKFVELTDNEYELIREKILEHLKAEGFQYNVPGQSYSSRFYRTSIKVVWNTPDQDKVQVIDV